MRLALVLVTMVASFPTFAETLNEAVQHSLVLNPDIIVNAAKGTYFPSFELNTATVVHSADRKKSYAGDTSFNQLNINLYEANQLKKEGLAEHHALDVVNQYLQVVLHEKLLEFAQVNLRLQRSIFLTIKQRHAEKKATKADLRLVTRQLALAEKELSRTEKNLHKVQKNYASVVGRWPGNLTIPPVPASSDLPDSVGQAIEQGLAGLPDVNHKKRSMIELSQSIRLSWDEWTTTGLKLNTLRKRLQATTQARDTSLERFKAGKGALKAVLAAQTSFYRTEVAYTQEDNADSFARFHILNSVGKLVSFITTHSTDELSKSTESMSELAVLSESDLSDFPYANYKSVENSLDNQTLALETNEKNQLTNKGAFNWYVAAGHFKNKANAIALVTRLQELGFMTSLHVGKHSCSVRIGPFEYRDYADKSLQRLKEMAHVQGSLITSGTEKIYG